jgi:hypothetical protein
MINIRWDMVFTSVTFQTYRVGKQGRADRPWALLVRLQLQLQVQLQVRLVISNIRSSAS